jgi:hypothetical protein
MSAIYVAIVNDDDSRKILGFCNVPKSTEEIIDYVFNYKHAMYAGSYKRSDDVVTLVGTRLAQLEALEGLTYENSKWKITTTARDVLQKYFGIKLS